MLRKSTTGYNLGKDWKEHYPVTAHAPNFDFRTGCREIKRCEESKRTLKIPFASRFVEFNTTLKLLRFTDQWYIFPVKLWFERNLDFLALLLLPLAGRASDGKRFDADWRLISSASFHTSSNKKYSEMKQHDATTDWGVVFRSHPSCMDYQNYTNPKYLCGP